MKIFRYLWALIPILSIGTLSWLAFAVIGIRHRSRGLTLSAVGYFALLVLLVGPVTQSDSGLNGLGAMLMVLLWGGSSYHALWWASKGRSRITTAPALRWPGPDGRADVAASVVQPPLADQRQRDCLLQEISAASSGFASAPSDRRIDPEIWTGLRQAVSDSWALLTAARRGDVGGDQLIAVEVMFADYVPSSVRAIAGIGPEQLVTPDDAVRVNRSAREIVDSIGRELQSMMRSVSSGDLAKLDQQAAFLHSRFGQPGGIQL